MPCQECPVTCRQGGDISGAMLKSGATVKLALEGAVAVITLDRPEAGNRVDAAMAAELREACGELAAAAISDTVRVVLLTGAGAVFSVGREIPAYAGELRAAAAVAALPMPVVAALNGDATDHGLELALAADVRLAAAGAMLGFAPPGEGGFPFDGATQRLPRLAGPGWARDLLLTGRRIPADLAMSIGLVSRVAARGEGVMDAARRLAGEIMAGGPIAARYIKEAVNLGADMTLAQGLGLEADLNVILHSTADRAEGIRAFLERRGAAGFLGE